MKVKLPDISDKNSEIVLTAWHVTENARVKEGQDLLEVVTDKATFDVPSPCCGTLVKIFKKKGEKISTGDIVAEIKEERV